MSDATTTPPVDLADGLARAGDDLEFYQELIEIFLDDAPARLHELRQAAAARQAEAVARVAHAVKGAAASLSAHRIRDLALTIERSSRENRLDGVDAAISELAAAIDELAAWAGDAVAGGDPD